MESKREDDNDQVNAADGIEKTRRDDQEDEEEDVNAFDPAESTFHTHYLTSSPSLTASSSSSSASVRSASPTPLALSSPSYHYALHPPFYNRPPTPLPPSPSLTSLLRPSRPTTPDSSPDELNTRSQSQSQSQSHVSARPLPRASPTVPTYEYYGFALYLFSSLAFGLYLLWSYLPSPFLHALGIYYYPNRWWSLALPAWLVVAVIWVFVALASYNTGYLTLALDNVECMVDRAGTVAVMNHPGLMTGFAAGESKRGRERADPFAGGALGSVATSAVAASGASGRAYGPGRKREKSKAKDAHNHRDRSRKASGHAGSQGHRRARESVDVDVRAWREIWSRGTDAVMDVPLGGVCELLYGEGRERDSHDED